MRHSCIMERLSPTLVPWVSKQVPIMGAANIRTPSSSYLRLIFGSLTYFSHLSSAWSFPHPLCFRYLWINLGRLVSQDLLIINVQDTSVYNLISWTMIVKRNKKTTQGHIKPACALTRTGFACFHPHSGQAPPYQKRVDGYWLCVVLFNWKFKLQHMIVKQDVK